MTLLNGSELSNLLSASFAQPGDQMFRMERLPQYTVPGQTEVREQWLAWRAGSGPHPDTTAIEKWAEKLADEAHRGMVRRRVRVLSEVLTADEAQSCDIALPVIARHQWTRVLHRGEHTPVDVLDHDYWVIQPAHGEVKVVRMVYSDAGEFEGAEIVPDDRIEPYLREMRLAWSIAEDFSAWWSRNRAQILSAA